MSKSKNSMGIVIAAAAATLFVTAPVISNAKEVSDFSVGSSGAKEQCKGFFSHCSSKQPEATKQDSRKQAAPQDQTQQN